MDRGAWQVTVHGVAKSQMPLKQLSTASILAWKIPLTEEPSRLQFVGCQTVEYDWATEHTDTIHRTSQFSWTHLKRAQNTYISQNNYIRQNNLTQSLFFIKYWIYHVIYWIPYWKCKTELLYGYRMVVSVSVVSLYQCDCGLTGTCGCCHCPASGESIDGISLAQEKIKIWSMFFTVYRFRTTVKSKNRKLNHGTPGTIHCYCSVAKSRLTLCDPMDTSVPASSVL